MISEEDDTLNCDICGMILEGQDESEENLRGNYLEGYKSLFAKRNVFLKQGIMKSIESWKSKVYLLKG